MTDEPRGQIVGKHLYSAEVLYDGRRQGSLIYRETEMDAVHAAQGCKNQIQKSCCGYPLYLYPDQSKWEIRIRG